MLKKSIKNLFKVMTLCVGIFALSLTQGCGGGDGADRPTDAEVQERILGVILLNYITTAQGTVTTVQNDPATCETFLGSLAQSPVENAPCGNGVDQGNFDVSFEGDFNCAAQGAIVVFDTDLDFDNCVIGDEVDGDFDVRYTLNANGTTLTADYESEDFESFILGKGNDDEFEGSFDELVVTLDVTDPAVPVIVACTGKVQVDGGADCDFDDTNATNGCTCIF